MAESSDPGVWVASFNIHHGAPAARQLCWGAPGAALDGCALDLVAIQEVDRWVVRSGFVHQVRALEARLGMHSVFAATRSLHGFGRYGHALLSSSPAQAVEIVALPRCWSEPRQAIVASVEIAGERVSVASTHLHNSRAVALIQLEALLEALVRRPGPHLLLGDLNIEPEVAGPVLESAGFAPTAMPLGFPASEPRRAIDWIVGAGVEVSEHRTIATDSSDHRPLLAKVTASRR